MTLYIYCDNNYLRQLLTDTVNNRRNSDSGFDVPMLQQNVQLAVPLHTFDLGIKVAAVEKDTPLPCLLLPRSSISNSPFRLSNSIGLIDSGYRGEVKAKVDIRREMAINFINEQYTIHHGTRLFQICRNNFLPWDNVVIVQFENELPQAQDNRGAGGFGSTN
jgi:dUTP pyrophosphatase